MTEEEREQYLFGLDEDLLKGSVMPSAWCTQLVLEADTAFINGAHLAAVITAMSGIEAQLRFDHSGPAGNLRLAQLIDKAGLPPDLTREIHDLRRFRNKWVHVSDPWEDEPLGEHRHDPYRLQAEIEPWALRAVTALRRLFYWDQGT